MSNEVGVSRPHLPATPTLPEDNTYSQLENNTTRKHDYYELEPKWLVDKGDGDHGNPANDSEGVVNVESGCGHEVEPTEYEIPSQIQ